MNRGEVVEVDRAFTDMTGSKTRPAVVVQADFLDGVIDDTIVVQITSTRHDLPGTEVLLDPTVETTSGLRKLCVANCTNILTFEQAQVIQTVGTLSAAAMSQIEACLKVVLGIH